MSVDTASARATAIALFGELLDLGFDCQLTGSAAVTPIDVRMTGSTEHVSVHVFTRRMTFGSLRRLMDVVERRSLEISFRHDAQGIGLVLRP